MQNGNAEKTCRRLNVPADVCYLRFSDRKVVNSDYFGSTSRGEMLILDFDAEGRVIGVELVGDGKPCQEP